MTLQWIKVHDRDMLNYKVDYFSHVSLRNNKATGALNSWCIYGAYGVIFEWYKQALEITLAPPLIA